MTSSITDEMVERAARAAWRYMEAEIPDHVPIPWEDLDEEVQERVRKRHRAALEAALREKE